MLLNQQHKRKKRRRRQMHKIKKLKMQIMRYNPKTNDIPYSVTYKVPYHEQTYLLDALRYIKDHLAPDLSCRLSSLYCKKRLLLYDD